MPQAAPSPATRALLAKAALAAEGGDRPAAIEMLRDGLDVFGDEPLLHIKLSRYLGEEIRLLESATHIVHALALLPGNAEAMLLAADAVNRAGDHLRALELFEAVHAVRGAEVEPLRPNPWDAMYVLAYGEERLRSKPFFNIGAGSFRHWLWRNIDFRHPSYPRACPDVVHDLMSRADFPLADGCADLVFTSHCFEHVSMPAVVKGFAEVHRILAPGGVFRISVPDVELAYRAYRENDRAFYLQDWPICKELPLKRRLEMPLSQYFVATVATCLTETAPPFSTLPVPDTEEVDALLRDKGLEDALDDLCARVPEDYQLRFPNAHVNWFTFGKLEDLLRAAGFDRIELSAHGRSRVPVMRDPGYFDRTYPYASLYVEAVKAPAATPEATLCHMPAFVP